MSRILIVGWVTPWNTNKQGVALSRRIGQAIQSFASLGWEVTVLQNDWVGESKKDSHEILFEENCSRIVYNVNHENYLNPQNPILRKLATFYVVSFLGDRSSAWSNSILRNKSFVDGHLKGFDLVVTFTSPKAPINIGYYLKTKFGTKWIADFQDNYDHGLSTSLISLHKIWIKSKLKLSDLCVQVSPEWAKRDSEAIGVNFVSIRHAVTKVHNSEIVNFENRGELRMFYSGNLSEKDQSLKLLAQTLQLSQELPIRIVLAGPDKLNSIFENHIPKDKIDFLGWLSPAELKNAIIGSDILLIVPWSSPGRLVIPSKMFEFLGYDKPIFICGEDTGAFLTLLEELTGANRIRFDDLQYNVEALKKAEEHNFEMMLTSSNIINPPINDNDLAFHYLRHLNH